MVLRYTIAGAGVAALALLRAASPWSTGSGCNRSGTFMIDDRASGAYSLTDASDGSARLEAVILARGRPGCVGESPPPGAYEGPPPQPGGRERLLSGGSAGRLMLVYERFAGIAWVGSRSVRMGTDNVLLVDRADSIPVIVGTMHITPSFAPAVSACAGRDPDAHTNAITAALASEPTVRTFLAP
jgi:hypothetical protein